MDREVTYLVLGLKEETKERKKDVARYDRYMETASNNISEPRQAVETRARGIGDNCSSFFFYFRKGLG